MNKDALLMAKICKISYIRKSDTDPAPDTEKIQVELKKLIPEFKEVHTFNKGSAQALIVETTNFNVIAFRGSDEVQDWIKNFTFFSKKQLGYSLHSGFLDITSRIFPHIHFQLSRIRPRPLFITGHSLGGAMAVVCALIFTRLNEDFKGLYTFGQPRVFKHGSAQKFNAITKGRYFRYENNNDGVPHAPPSFFNFKHAGKLFYITIRKKVVEKIGFFKSHIDHILGVILAIREKGIDFSEDHAIEKYIDALR